jgi:hypothetical protein
LRTASAIELTDEQRQQLQRWTKSSTVTVRPPPEHALVLCRDKKSQVQALDRTQPGLPLKKGRAATMTHDYKRPGTTT